MTYFQPNAIQRKRGFAFTFMVTKVVTSLCLDSLGEISLVESSLEDESPPDEDPSGLGLAESLENDRLKMPCCLLRREACRVFEGNKVDVLDGTSECKRMYEKLRPTDDA